jgi:murein DD-endopeptidase MepM/ murein hydrolase activator NlpD
VTRARTTVWLGAAALIVALAGVGSAAVQPSITVHPSRPRPGDVAWLHVGGVSAAAAIEGTAVGQPLRFFPHSGGQSALLGLDLETKPGAHDWQVAVREEGREPRTRSGRLTVAAREFPVQRLTLPPGMVDLDPETERRATAETERLRTLYRTVTPERLWRGPFVKPVAINESGTGFGARRIINGKPRAPHAAIDFAAPEGTPVLSANTGRVALVGDFFFPGRLVIIDHGLGLYTLYFHLSTIGVGEGDRVERGQPVGTVGATGRATGPHLHFGAQLGPARLDPDVLLALDLRD